MSNIKTSNSTVQAYFNSGNWYKQISDRQYKISDHVATSIVDTMRSGNQTVSGISTLLREGLNSYKNLSKHTFKTNHKKQFIIEVINKIEEFQGNTGNSLHSEFCSNKNEWFFKLGHPDKFVSMDIASKIFKFLGTTIVVPPPNLASTAAGTSFSGLLLESNVPRFPMGRSLASERLSATDRAVRHYRNSLTPPQSAASTSPFSEIPVASPRQIGVDLGSPGSSFNGSPYSPAGFRLNLVSPIQEQSDSEAPVQEEGSVASSCDSGFNDGLFVTPVKSSDTPVSVSKTRRSSIVESLNGAWKYVSSAVNSPQDS
jgi:hypothetical protein